MKWSIPWDNVLQPFTVVSPRLCITEISCPYVPGERWYLQCFDLLIILQEVWCCYDEIISSVITLTYSMLKTTASFQWFQVHYRPVVLMIKLHQGAYKEVMPYRNASVNIPCNLLLHQCGEPKGSGQKITIYFLILCDTICIYKLMIQFSFVVQRAWLWQMRL